MTARAAGALRLGGPDVPVAAAGVLATLFAALVVSRADTSTGLVAVGGLFAFVVVVAAFVRIPHVAVACAIPFFALVPVLKQFVDPRTGALKDLVTIAAVLATVIVVLERRLGRRGWPVDIPTLALVALMLTVYVFNSGGLLSGESGYGIAWFHGVRLFAEPLLLLVVGLAVRDPRRVLRWAVASVLATAVVNAIYGLYQQLLDVPGLLGLGYTYGLQVRQIGHQLRSFGTMDEPFAFAGFMLLALAVALLGLRRGMLGVAVTGILGLGLASSFVRTAAGIALALLAVRVWRGGRPAVAAVLAAAAVTAALATFIGLSRGTSTETVRLSPSQYLTLNGRTNIWASQIESPSAWAFGRGVGVVGTASERAQKSLTGKSVNRASTGGTVVDSGYFAVIADVGLLGLAVLLALFGRLSANALRAVREGADAGWIVLGLVSVMALDAVTRESFTGFPTAYVGMLLVGLASATYAPHRGAGRIAT